VKNVMRGNIEKVIERGEKIEDLQSDVGTVFSKTIHSIY